MPPGPPRSHTPAALASRPRPAPRPAAPSRPLAHPRSAVHPRPFQHRPQDAARRGAAIQALLRDLTSELRRGPTLEAAARAEAPRRHPSGLPALDSLLGGGFPAGGLCEIAGPLSSGRTSLALALLARTTRDAGELAAVVDRADAFDPPSAEAAGVDLSRVLWARAGGEWREALRCVERLLQTEGIPLVLLDWGVPTCHAHAVPDVPTAAWTRLARLAGSSRSLLMVLGERRLTGCQAEVVLEMEPARACFSGCPPLLEEITARARLARHRGAPSGQAVELRLGVGSPARRRDPPARPALSAPADAPSGPSG